VRIVSVNVSAGRTVLWRGRPVETGIFKEPVPDRVRVRFEGLEGDRQADTRVHGGVFKAVYAYSLEHYSWWIRELGRPLGPGAFGENLTIGGFDEEEICVGDVLRAGDALLQAIQPRLPCRKLAIRFRDPGMVKRFMQGGRFGVYFRVIEEGALRCGDTVTRVTSDSIRLPVPRLAGLLDPETRDPDVRRLALQCAALPPEWTELLGVRRIEDER
jgi:MOSC domain-containing protein YiiM